MHEYVVEPQEKKKNKLWILIKNISWYLGFGYTYYQ